MDPIDKLRNLRFGLDKTGEDPDVSTPGGRPRQGRDTAQFTPPQALPVLGEAGKRAKLILAAETSGKKTNLRVLAQLSGMTNMAIRDIRYKMIKNEARVRFRPAGEARKLRKRKAIPKWEELKMKTINEDDVALGAPRSGLRQPGYFDPKKPDDTLKTGDPKRYEALMQRFDQRKTEFRELADAVEKYKQQGDIIVENGVVKEGARGKTIAGDYDIYEFLDKHGSRIAPADPRYAKIYQDLTGRRIQVQHPAHVDWQPTDDFEKQIKDEIIQRHKTKAPLYEFREDGSVWEVFAD